MAKINFRRRAYRLKLAACVAGICLTASAQETGSANQSKYIGPGSCSATACHGGVQPRSTTHVLQNEYSTWVVQDTHAKAFRSLQNPISKRMGRILGIASPESSPKCLACHTLAVPAA